MSAVIREKCESFALSNKLLKQVMDRLNENINKGLKKETHSKAVVKCFPSFVQDLPKGNEEGKYLVLDLDDEKIHVSMIYFENNTFLTKHNTYSIAKELMICPGAQLFDYFAQCLEEFVQSEGENHEMLELCFSFNFAVSQEKLAEGILVRWTKDYTCEGVVGESVTALLQEAIHRRNNLLINVVAILNDTTGCLVACAYTQEHCRVGVIVGTGFNACYVEKCTNIDTFINESEKPFVFVNTEWGAFGDDGALNFVQTEVDHILNQHSVNRGQQTYEKMVSGLYMGEIARLMIEKFTQESILFNGKGSSRLSTHGILTTNDITAIESAKKGNLSICRKLLIQKLGLPHVTAEDCINVEYICRLVFRRSAHLASAGVACLINRMDWPVVTVAVDGYVFHNPHYHSLMAEKISELVSHGKIVALVSSQDKRVMGAALVAATVSRANKEKKELEEKRKREEEIHKREEELAMMTMWTEDENIEENFDTPDSPFSFHLF